MDRKTQEFFFQNSVDMNALAKCSADMIDGIKKAGDPKRLKIEIRKAEEFDNKLSSEEIVEQIDKEYSEESSYLDMVRISKVSNYYVIIGVKL